MFFFFRRPKVEIIAYCRSPHALAFEHNPISPARNFIPSWWKDVESSQFDWNVFQARTTAKACPGIINSFIKGFMLPAWCDIALAFKDREWRYRFSDSRSSMEYHHGPEQVPGFYKDHHFLKIQSPWILQSPVDIQYSSPFYYHTDPQPYIVPPGIITPVNGMCPTNVFLIIKYPEQDQEVKFIIKNSTPLMNILPLTEKEVVLKPVLLDENETQKIEAKYGHGSHFTLRGLRYIHQTKSKKK